MSEELRPCPFCGGKEQTVTPSFDPDDLEFMTFDETDGFEICDVTCSNERCINGWRLTPKAWNTRPIEDALQARIVELNGFINQLIEAGNEMYEESYWYENKWQALVKDWKEM